MFKKGSLRTQDIGRKGHSKRIAGRLKSTGRWSTQNFLILKKDLKSLKTRQLIKSITLKYPKGGSR